MGGDTTAYRGDKSPASPYQPLWVGLVWCSRRHVALSDSYHTAETAHELRSVDRNHRPTHPPHRMCMEPSEARCAERLGSPGPSRPSSSGRPPASPIRHQHTMAATSRRRSDPFACASPCALQRPLDRNCRWIRPAVGVSKHGWSAGMHGDEGVEEERAPGRKQRGAQGMDRRDQERWGEGLRAGHRPRARLRRGRASPQPPRSRTPSPGISRRRVTARGFKKSRPSMRCRPAPPAN